MSLVVEVEAGLELYLRAGANTRDESLGRGIRARTLTNDADDRAQPVRVLECEQGCFLLWVEPGLLARRDGCGSTSEHELDVAARERLRLEPGGAPDPGERVFASCKLTLFPRSKRELTASCSCPDWANPCKHVAAVYYLLAERFDENPFLIFAWRGREQDELVERLRARRGAGTSRGRTDRRSRPPQQDAPLHAVLDSFWSSGPELRAFSAVARDFCPNCCPSVMT